MSKDNKVHQEKKLRKIPDSRGFSGFLLTTQWNLITGGFSQLGL